MHGAGCYLDKQVRVRVTVTVTVTVRVRIRVRVRVKVRVRKPERLVSRHTATRHQTPPAPTPKPP